MQATVYAQLQTRLATQPCTWLVTGGAGFIGSNLMETLLKLGQRVVGLANFVTGHQRNLDEVQTLVSPAQWANFSFIKGDIREQADCQRAMVWNPARHGEQRAAIQDPAFSTMDGHALRPRDDEKGAVITSPASVIASEARQSMPPTKSPVNQVYNVAVGDRTTLNELFSLLRDNLASHGVSASVQPVYREFRAGDVRHSQADIGKAQRLLGYAPTHPLAAGVGEAMPWYVAAQLA